jgi:hypothetical protein
MSKRIVDQFFKFIQTREAIRIARASRPQEWPWSDDPILNNYHFTNVRRSDDKGTKWIVEHLGERSMSSHEVLLKTYAYRCLNRLETFVRYGTPRLEDPAVWVRMLSFARKQGVVIGSGNHQTNFGRMAKGLNVLAGKRGPAIVRELEWVDTHIGGMRVLMSAGISVGPFISNQIVSDLALVGFGNFKKDMSCVVSSGSRIAVELIRGRATFESIQRIRDRARATGLNFTDLWTSTRRFKEDDDEMKVLQALHDDPRARALHMTFVDVEHSLCEFWKYLNIKQGDGRKNRFHMSKEKS